MNANAVKYMKIAKEVKIFKRKKKKKRLKVQNLFEGRRIE